MILSFTAIIDGRAFEITAKIYLIDDNLGVAASEFRSMEIVELEAWDVVTGQRAVLEADSALKNRIEDAVFEFADRLGVIY